ncbi:MAG: hypothetical protein HY868_27725 [Chloroflexi bacterium]|nr:hypothetical protein [Chloroflexota bacterium]
MLTALWLTLLIVNGIEYLLEWTRALYTTLRAPLGLPFNPLFDHTEKILPSLLTAHLGLLVALVAARALAFLASRVTIWTHGIQFESPLGARLIRYDALRAIHSIEFKTTGRFVVWVDAAQGLPLQNFLASLLIGKWTPAGFLLTSDLRGFDEVVATLVARLKEKYGVAGFETRFSEDEPSTLLTILTAPRATLKELAATTPVAITPRDAVWHSVSSACALALPLAVAALIHAQLPVGMFVVPFVALVEFALAPLYLTAAPLDSLRRIDFADAWRVYPLTQLPRWGIAFALTYLVILGMPLFVFVMCIAPAVALGCYTVLVFARDWFEVPLAQAWLAVLMTAIWQIVVYALFVTMLSN